MPAKQSSISNGGNEVHEMYQPPEQQPIQQPIQPPMPMPPAPKPMPNPPPMPMPGNPCFSPEMSGGANAYSNMYPDIYYKLQPHVSMACDEMEINGLMLPTTRMMNCMCSRIHENVCRMYPEMLNYANSWSAAPNPQAMDYDRSFDGGPIKDIIAVLLLAELFRRRRVY